MSASSGFWISEDRLGYGPDSQAWLIAALTHPYHSDPGRARSDEHAQLLAQALIVEGERDAESAYHYAQEHGLFLVGSVIGWLTREGEILGCHYAAHERLLKVMNTATRAAERFGWARVARDKIRCGYKLSTKQKSAIRGLPGLEWHRSDEVGLPDWKAPSKLEQIDLALEGVRESLPYGSHFLYEIGEDEAAPTATVTRIRGTYGLTTQAIEDRILQITDSMGVQLTVQCVPEPVRP